MDQMTRSSRPNWFNGQCIYFLLDGMKKSLSFSGVSSATATRWQKKKLGTCGPREVCSSIRLKD